jgi:heavy metal sensor kinase
MIWTGDGRLLRAMPAGTKNVPDPGPRAGELPGQRDSQPPTIRQRGDLREAYLGGPAGSRVLVGKSIGPLRAELHRMALLLAAAGAGVLIISLGGGWLLSQRAVRPIHAITAAAQEISASNLSRRIDLAGTQSELGTLALVLNDTFARLETAFQQQVRFTADASHELRTPLAVMHTNVQLALSRERTVAEYQKMFQTCLRASERMKNLVDSLLLLARADAGRLTLNCCEFDLRDIVKDSLDMVAPLAAAKNVTVQSDIPSTGLTADPSRLAQVVTNLLTNAIRYNREGGRVEITLAARGDEIALVIADTGVGIDAAQQKCLFERFYRVDMARSREDGGSGLGLSICKTIVESHGGSISFTSEIDKGSTFFVRLPRQAKVPVEKNPAVDIS